MRRVTMVRLGIAAALATMGVVGAIGSGCSSSTTVTTPDGGQTGAGPDGGTGATGPDGSTGPTDGGTGSSETGVKDGASGFDVQVPVEDGKVVQVFLWATKPDALQAAVIPLSVP